MQGVLDVRLREHVGDAAVHQELRLRRVAEHLEAARARGARKRAEIDMRGDVLLARPLERIAVRAVACMAHQRAHRALRVVVLVARETVVDDEDHAFGELRGEAAHPGLPRETELALVGRRDFDGLRFLEHRAARRSLVPRKILGNSSFHDSAAAPPHCVHGHGVEHLVRDHHAAKGLGQPVEEPHLAAEPCRLAAAQRAARLENQVFALELPQQRLGEGSRSGSQLEDGPFDLVYLPCEGSPKQAAKLGRGDEVSLRAELAVAASVIGLHGELHVARERDPAAVRCNFLADGVDKHAGNLP